jgi:hypothetical protein
VATIGVRGTDFTLRYCQDKQGRSDCDDLTRQGVTPPHSGLYIGINGGVVEITNQGGTLVSSAGEYVYVENSQTQPTRLPDSPAILAVDDLPNPADDSSADFIGGSHCK